MKKWMPYLMAAYVVVCLAFSLCAFFKKEDVIRTDNYGMATDDAVCLARGSSITASFCLGADGFQGVSVKFQSDYAFQSEKIRAGLYDRTNGKLLAEYTADLCYEMVRNKDYGSTIYFPLQVEDAAGTEVDLTFTLEGETIFVEPELVVSGTGMEDSTLYLDGEQIDGNLVFAARYRLGEHYDFHALVKGVFALVAGAALFWGMWAGEGRRKKRSPGSDYGAAEESSNFVGNCRETGEAKERIWITGDKGAGIEKNEVCAQEGGEANPEKREVRARECPGANKKRTLAGGIILAGIVLVLCVYVYQYGVELRMDMRAEEKIVKQAPEQEPLLLSEQTGVVEQQFVCTKNRLNAVILPVNLEQAGVDTGAAAEKARGTEEQGAAGAAEEKVNGATEEGTTGERAAGTNAAAEKETTGGGTDAGIRATLTDLTTGKVLAEQFLALESTTEQQGQKNPAAEAEELTKMAVRLSQTELKTKGHTLSLRLDCSAMGEEVVGLAAGKAKDEVQLSLGSAMTSGLSGSPDSTDMPGLTDTSAASDAPTALAMSLVFEDTAFLKPLYLILCAGLLLFACAVYYFCFWRRASLETIFLPFGLLMGLLLMSVISLYTVPDEPSHIDSAYQLSNELMGIPDSSKPGYIYKRKDDADSAVEEKQSLDVTSYERLSRQLFQRVQDETLVECAASNNYANAGRLYYFPQAVGITLGRLLKLGMMPTLMLGRLVSLICYLLLTYAALRMMPFAKLSLFLVGVLPITLQQAASFSYDAVLNAAAFLFVSSVLAIAYEDGPVKNSRAVVAMATGCMMTTVKGGVYLPLAVLPLLLLLRSGVKRKKHCQAELPAGSEEQQKGLFIGSEKQVQKLRWGLLLMAVPVLAFLSNNLASTLGRLLAEQGSLVGGSANSEIYTFGYLLRYPHRFIGMFVNTFYRQGDSYLRNLFGGNLGWREVNITWSVVTGFVVVVLASCPGTEQERIPRCKEKVLFGVVSVGSFCLIELSMLLAWTPVTINFITGVQGRYFLPFFVLVLLIFRNHLLQLRRGIDRELILAAGVLEVVTVLQVVQFVCK